MSFFFHQAAFFGAQLRSFCITGCNDLTLQHCNSGVSQDDLMVGSVAQLGLQGLLYVHETCHTLKLPWSHACQLWGRDL